MPFFVKVSDNHCRKFLSRPNTYSLCFPSGHDFFFSLPFDMDSLSLMRPKELFALHRFLSYASKDMTPAETLNTLNVQLLISRRLADSEALRPVERRAWTAGHGYPIFDHNDILVGFSWDWTHIEFEGGKELVSMYMESISEQNKQQAMKRTAEEDAITVLRWEKNGHQAFVWKRHGKTICFYIYGAYFRNFSDWEQVEAKLTEQELDELDRGLVTLRSRPDGGYSLLSVESKEEQGRRRSSERRHSSDIVVPVKMFKQPLPPPLYPRDEEYHHTSTPLKDVLAQNSLQPKYPPSSISHQPKTCKHSKNDNTNHATSETDTTNLINMYGAIFECENDWLSFASTLPNTILHFLEHGILKLQGCTHNGIAVVWIPHPDARVEETGDEESTGHDSYRDDHKQQTHTQSHNTLEQLYQVNLLTHTTLNHIRNRCIRQRTQGLDSMLLRVYRDMRDNGASVNEATKQILQLKEMELQRRHRGGKKEGRPSVENIASCFFESFEEATRNEQKHEQESSTATREKMTASGGKGDSNGGFVNRGDLNNSYDHYKKYEEPIPIPKPNYTYPRTPLATATTHTNLYNPPNHPTRTHNPTIHHITPPISPPLYQFPYKFSPHPHTQSTPTPTHPPTSAVPTQKKRPSSTEKPDKKPRYQAYAEESADGDDEITAVKGSWRDV
ncbi:hypothetical protein L13192_07074 [Pyrenophora tritici-repentis]|nr:hypothetical protein L13192_07074 [Pyrenophora tritici-repentis]KAI1683470.1 hypothetical protein KJE20_05975 [Pyrenophora tritici-repentis]